MLTVASGMSPLAMALCIPALPVIGGEFAASPADTQYLVSGFLVGLGLSQPLLGACADHAGRRPVILTAFAIFALASLACIFAWNLASLVGFRFLQATGVAAGTVVARAVIRDLAGADHTTRYIAYLAAGMGLAPMVAPLIGGMLVEQSGWRSTFTAAAVAAVLIWLWLFRSLPETVARSGQRRGGSPLAKFARVAESRRFWSYTLLMGFSNSAYFMFSALAPAFFRDHFGIGAGGFGLYAGMLSLAYVSGAWLGAVVTRSQGPGRCLRLGLLGSGLGAALVLGWTVAGSQDLWTLTAFVVLMYGSAGLVNPPAMAGAMLEHADLAASASGLSSSVALCVSALATVIGGYLYAGTAASFGAPIAVTLFIAIGVYTLLATGPAGTPVGARPESSKADA